MGGHHFGQPCTLLFPFDIQIVARPLSLAYALDYFFLIVLLTFLHRDRAPLVYVCFIQEFRELWAYRHIFFLLFFPPSHYYILSYLIGCILHIFFFILSILVLLHILSTLSGDPPQLITWRIVISFPLYIPQTLIQRFLV